MEANKQLADQHGLALMAYEGGQHLTGILGAENDEELTAKLNAANGDPRMGLLYRRYHRDWERVFGQLFCHFSSVSDWTKWGSWGLIEQYDDDPYASPKFKEVMRWANQAGG
jgi:hypothetical protein